MLRSANLGRKMMPPPELPTTNLIAHDPGPLVVTVVTIAVTIDETIIGTTPVLNLNPHLTDAGPTGLLKIRTLGSRSSNCSLPVEISLLAHFPYRKAYFVYYLHRGI